jgi:hypothetical protein
MSLSNLIHGKRDFATAALATPATVPPFPVLGVAKVAAVAVANPQKTKTAFLKTEDEMAIRAWLALIGETDLAVVREVLGNCRSNSEARDYFLGRAAESTAEN